MNFNNGKIIFPLLLFFCIILFPSVSSQPIVQEVTCYPLGPMPLPYVTFTVGINNNNSSIDQVCLIVNECMKDLCSVTFQNLTMNFTYSCCMDFYETKFNFSREDVTQLKYHLEILSNDTWYIFNTGFINLSSNPDNNIIDNKKNTTPGFEFVLLIFSVGLLLIRRHYKLKKKLIQIR